MTPEHKIKELTERIAQLERQLENLGRCASHSDDVAYQLRCELSAANVTEGPARTALIKIMQINDEYGMEGGSLFHENAREDVLKIMREAGIR